MNSGTSEASETNRAAAEPGRDESVRPGQSWLVRKGVLLEPGPRRTLANASFVNMVGSGMWMAAAALYFTRSVGLSVAEVGLGMGIGTAVGLLAGMPVGRLADSRGPREVYVVTLLAQTLSMAAMALVNSFWLFLLVICLTELAGSAAKSSRAPLGARFRRT